MTKQETQAVEVIVGPVDPVEEKIHARVMGDPEARRAYFQQRAMLKLGQAIRAAREQAGLSQAALARAAGMTQAEISRIENALPVKGVTLATMVNLSDALDFRIAFEFPKYPGAVELEPASMEEQGIAHLTVRELT